MESALTTIAEQAGLERVLFTPAMKKQYFELAVAAGGSTQFKHVDSIRNGINSAIEKTEHKKRVLTVCAVYELAFAYDLLLKAARELAPIAVVAISNPNDEATWSRASFLPYSQTGWLQFLTHTQQELYDHLLLAYQLFEVKKLNIPVLIVQPAFAAPGELRPRNAKGMENLHTGFGAKPKTKGLDFDAALQAVKHKQEKPTLESAHALAVNTLRELYTAMGYACPAAAFPWAGRPEPAESAILSLIPFQEPAAPKSLLRPLCLRPLLREAIANQFAQTKTLAVVEPNFALGLALPTFYSEITAVLSRRKITTVPFITSHMVLESQSVDFIESTLDQTQPGDSGVPQVFDLDQ